MDRVIFNDLLKRYDYDEAARDEFYHYVLPNIIRRLKAKYFTLPNIKDVAHNIMLYFIEHRPKDYVYAPYKYICKCVDNYMASHLKLFDNDLPLTEEVSYEQNFDELEKMEVMQSLEITLKDKITALLFYRHYIEGDSEKDLAGEFGLSYANVRAKLSRAKKKLKKHYTECNNN